MTEIAITAELAELLDGCLGAVEEEIEAVRGELARRGLDAPLEGSDGHLRESVGDGWTYAWTLPPGRRDVRLEDAVRVSCERGEGLGFVTHFDRAARVVSVAMSEWLGPAPSFAELAFDPTWLLAALADRLEEIAAEPGRFHPGTALRLLGRSWPEVGRREPAGTAAADLNDSQREALARVLGSDTHFVWGPPGTGKTLLLGHAVAELAAEGPVLVAATTNGAVDEAAARCADALRPGAIEANRIVRVGARFSGSGDASLSLEAAVDRRVAVVEGGLGRALRRLEEELLPPGAARAASARGGGAKAGRGHGGAKGVWARYGRLMAAAHATEDPTWVSRVGRIAGEIRAVGVRVLEEADVVLTTFARLTVREELAGLRFRSLVIDEASTAPLPYVLMAAARASGRAVAIGDFQQLPAVVISRGERAARWLSRDAFREAGIVGDRDEAGELHIPSPSDHLCAMLVEQYRMRPELRAIVGDLFYGGRLRDAAAIRRRPPPRVAPLILFDTTGLLPRVERAEGSRANPAHAEAILPLLELLARRGVHDVALIAPYRLQCRRLRELVRGRLGKVAPRRLEISTIHRFQGREKAAVVIDTVDAPPGGSWFLHDGRNRDFPRLLNVALSRCRDSLILVGTREGLLQTLPAGALLNRVIARIAAEGVTVDAAAGDAALRRVMTGR